MNYLAHIFLSPKEEHIMMGNFLGDMLAPQELLDLPVPWQEGVRYHRFIDRTMDDHHLVSRSKGLLYGDLRKYAAVALDVYYDYFLAKNLHQYSDIGLRAFCDRTYDILDRNIAFVPSRLRDRVATMIEYDWLYNYGSYEGISHAMGRLAKRATFENNLGLAVAVLQREESKLEDHFLIAFPDILRLCKGYEFDIAR